MMNYESAHEVYSHICSLVAQCKTKDKEKRKRLIVELKHAYKLHRSLRAERKHLSSEQGTYDDDLWWEAIHARDSLMEETYPNDDYHYPLSLWIETFGHDDTKGYVADVLEV